MRPVKDVPRIVMRYHDNIPNDEWDRYFMRIAREVAQNSKCLSRYIGAVVVKDKQIIATGYNGPPRGVDPCWKRNNDYERKCPRQKAGFKSGEGLEMCIAGHAERNALIGAARMGTSTKGASLVCYCGPPCKDCMIEIINAGIVEIVYWDRGTTGKFGIWYDELSEYLAKQSGILIRGVKLDER
jgi:dCMP deaminase